MIEKHDVIGGEPKLKTRITELLGIKYPIIQAGMCYVASPQLAAAVWADGTYSSSVRDSGG